MKILVVAFSYPPELGAAPSRLANMAEGLQKSGAEVDVLTALPNYPKGRIFDGYRARFYKKDIVNGINVYRYWTYPTISKKPVKRILNMFAFAFSLWAFAFRFKKIRSYNYVVIQSPPLVGAKSAMVLFKSLYRRKVVLNVSDLWPSTAVELGAIREGSVSHKYMCRLEKFLYRKADAIQCQSNELIQNICIDKPFFLYRNLQPTTINECFVESIAPFKIVYAGLCGVAQDILGLIKNIDFAKYGAEFHIYGGGNQANEIVDYLKAGCNSVYYHGFLDKAQMVNELSHYHASIVPLVTHITGAVPSKIFDLLPVGVPILFCGGGEGAQIVSDYHLGYVSEPADYKALEANIALISSMGINEYNALKMNCYSAARTDFSYEYQMGKYMEFLENI